MYRLSIVIGRRAAGIASGLICMLGAYALTVAIIALHHLLDPAQYPISFALAGIAFSALTYCVGMGLADEALATGLHPLARYTPLTPWRLLWLNLACSPAGLVVVLTSPLLLLLCLAPLMIPEATFDMLICFNASLTTLVLAFLPFLVRISPRRGVLRWFFVPVALTQALFVRIPRLLGGWTFAFWLLLIVTLSIYRWPAAQGFLALVNLLAGWGLPGALVMFLLAPHAGVGFVHAPAMPDWASPLFSLFLLVLLFSEISWFRHAYPAHIQAIFERQALEPPAQSHEQETSDRIEWIHEYTLPPADEPERDLEQDATASLPTLADFNKAGDDLHPPYQTGLSFADQLRRHGRFINTNSVKVDISFAILCLVIILGLALIKPLHQIEFSRLRAWQVFSFLGFFLLSAVVILFARRDARLIVLPRLFKNVAVYLPVSWRDAETLLRSHGHWANPLLDLVFGLLVARHLGGGPFAAAGFASFLFIIRQYPWPLLRLEGESRTGNYAPLRWFLLGHWLVFIPTLVWLLRAGLPWYAAAGWAALAALVLLRLAFAVGERSPRFRNAHYMDLPERRLTPRR